MPHQITIITVHQSRRNQTMDDNNDDDNNTMWWTNIPRTQFSRHLWPYPLHRPNNTLYHPMIGGILGIDIALIPIPDEHLIVHDIHFYNHTLMYRDNNHWYNHESNNHIRSNHEVIFIDLNNHIWYTHLAEYLLLDGFRLVEWIGLNYNRNLLPRWFLPFYHDRNIIMSQRNQIYRFNMTREQLHTMLTSFLLDNIIHDDLENDDYNDELDIEHNDIDGNDEFNDNTSI